MASMRRKINRGSLKVTIDSSGNQVIYKVVKGGNGKLTKARRKRLPPKTMVVNVIDLKEKYSNTSV